MYDADVKFTRRPLHLALAGALGALLGAAATPARAQQPADTALLRLDVNLPAYRLTARERGGATTEIRIAIGRRDFPTPTGRFSVTDITWNPWWHPPSSAWAANDTVTPPCPTNPMGSVKLGFGRGYFIHGTPAPQSVGRAASHGCLRTDNGDVRALAERIVTVVQPDALPEVQAWAASARTHVLRLRTPVPLTVRYDLAEVRGDTLWLYPDVYRRAGSTARRIQLARQALAAAGRDSMAIDEPRLAQLVAASRRQPVAVAIP